MNKLANLYAAQGAFEKAIPMFEDAKRVITKYLGAQHEDVPIVDDNIRAAHADMQKAANTAPSPGDDRLKAAPQK